jgi:hypothetical protein
MEIKIHDQEVLLQKLWKSRKLFKQDLQTVDGENLEVIFAGVENLDAGPDFKDAVIKIAGRLLKGDVEVHLTEMGWYEHGHHTDPRYNNVILHLISQKPRGTIAVQREDGASIHQLYIAPDEQKSALWKSKSDESEPEPEITIIENCPLSHSARDKILATLDAAGRARLLARAEQFREDLRGASWDQLLYKKMMSALGYAKNQRPFEKLAELAPYEMVRAEMQWVEEEKALQKCAALLFGAAGLLPSQTQPGGEILDAPTLTYVAPLERLWGQISHRLEIKAMKSHAWQFFRLRPQNFPTRRLAGMVQLLFRFYRQGFLEGFLKIFEGHAQDYTRIAAELENALIIKAEGYWREHYRFEEGAAEATEALVGKERARDIVINIVLPALFLYSSEASASGLRNTLQEIYARFPKLSENVITRVMKQQLFKHTRESGSAKLSALTQQGAIHLHKLYCRPLRCSECLQLSDSASSS